MQKTSTASRRQRPDGLLPIAGLGGDGTVTVPQRIAPVNALLDVAPPRRREALLVAFLDRLTR